MGKTGIQLFNNEEFGSVRTITVNEKTWFCGSDVAKALGYSNYSDALKRHCKGVVKHDILTKGGKQAVSFISEGDIYRLVSHSKLPSAERFESWIYDEVLPSIRKNGGYIMTTPDMDDMDIMARAILVAQKQIKEKDMIIEAQEDELKERENKINGLTSVIKTAKPFIAFAAGVQNSETDVDFADYAAYLQNDYEINIGRNTLMEFCRDRGYLCGKQKEWNRPSQRMISQGYMTYMVIPMRIGGKNVTKFKPMLTGKGQVWLYKQIKEWYGNQNYEQDILNDLMAYGE